MKLFVLVLNKTEVMQRILSAFVEIGVTGTTVVDCHGMLSTLGATDNELPIFGSLRQLLNGTHNAEGKLLLTVMTESQARDARDIIDKAVGGIEKPDTGIIFTVPIDYVEGLAANN